MLIEVNGVHFHCFQWALDQVLHSTRSISLAKEFDEALLSLRVLFQVCAYRPSITKLSVCYFPPVLNVLTNSLKKSKSEFF